MNPSTLTPACQLCTHYRGGEINGNCTRPMKMQSGEGITMPRPFQTERDEKNPFWKTKGRNLGDVCGATGKHWSSAKKVVAA